MENFESDSVDDIGELDEKKLLHFGFSISPTELATVKLKLGINRCSMKKFVMDCFALLAEENEDFYRLMHDRKIFRHVSLISKESKEVKARKYKLLATYLNLIGGDPLKIVDDISIQEVAKYEAEFLKKMEKYSEKKD